MGASKNRHYEGDTIEESPVFVLRLGGSSLRSE